MFKKISLAAVVALSAALPMAAQAESNVSTGAGALTATARVNFSIVIPKVLWLQVGTGTLLAANPAIDTLTFTVPTGSVGSGTPVAATGGNSGPSGLVFNLISTGGPVTLSAAGAVPTNAASNTIPWSQIAITPSGTAPTAPVPGGASVSVPAAGGFVNASGAWTYSFLNAGVVPSGTYAATVTYTAAVP
jgi:hypothetical protein